MNIYEATVLTSLFAQHFKADEKPELKLKILDCGCGTGRCGSLLKPFSSHLCGIDLFESALDQARQRELYNRLVIGDISHRLPFGDSFFDCSVAFEVIEHLVKKDGENMLKELERVTNTLIILSTPNTWMPKNDAVERYGGNPHMAHRSKWKTSDFKKLNYTVRGLGLKWGRSIGMSALLTWRLPWIAKKLFVWKVLNG